VSPYINVERFWPITVYLLFSCYVYMII
jgi:hypothetical protein